jgi:hypothetical protein
MAQGGWQSNYRGTLKTDATITTRNSYVLIESAFTIRQARGCVRIAFSIQTMASSNRSGSHPFHLLFNTSRLQAYQATGTEGAKGYA